MLGLSQGMFNVRSEADRVAQSEAEERLARIKRERESGRRGNIG